MSKTWPSVPLMKNSTIQLTKNIWYWDLFCGSCDCQCQLLTNNRRPPPPSTTTCCSIHVLRPTFYVPIRKDSLKYIIENCDPQKKPPATQKNWLPLLNSCPLSEHCLLVVALEHSRVLAIFCSTVFPSDHPCIESKQSTLNTWMVWNENCATRNCEYSRVLECHHYWGGDGTDMAAIYILSYD